MSTLAIPLTALGVPVISVPPRASASRDPHAPINLARLLDRLDAQLNEEVQPTDGQDGWRAAGIAIALTHANTALSNLLATQGTSAEVSSLRVRLQRATQRYVQLHPLQHSTPLPDIVNSAATVNARDYLVQGLTEDSDTGSEFEDDIGTAQSRTGEGSLTETEIDLSMGGSAPIADISKGMKKDNDEGELEEYMTAGTIRRRANATDKREDGEEAEREEDVAPPTALQSERTVQDSLSSELLRMAGILKANSIKFADSLERDRKILEDADEKLQGNLTLMTRTRGRLGEYSRKARGMGWITLGAVTMVCMSWVVMFVLIRLT